MPPATLPGPFAMLTTSSHLPRRCLAYRTLQLWSLCALWSSICIAVHKPRAFHYCGLSVEPEAPEALVIHSAGWIPHTALIRTHGLFKSLGVEYPINPSDSTSLRTMKLKLLVSIKALSVKKATPRSINLVMAKCLYARGAYVGILSSWSLRECDEIDSIFASELRRRSKNLRTSQTENLYQPVREGGLGFQRFSSMVQQRKRNCIHRLLAHGDVWTKLYASVHKTWPWITTPFIPRLYTTIILRIIPEKSGLSLWISIGYPRAWNRLIHAVLYPVIIPSIRRWISMKDIHGLIQANRGYP